MNVSRPPAAAVSHLAVAMRVVALSPLTPEPPSPMLTTPTRDQEAASRTEDLAQRPAEGRPPPVQVCADWQVLLQLPQTEAWLRASGARVTRLTRSVAQDAHNRHVDAHLLQLKDICEDISDHVEQIHALLETELSLKLLSYSVNIIVDIRTVQLLWHQLRVSVLVLKERLLRGLQDPNGNFTRQTDILQAFRQDLDQDPQQTRRLDALTEVDDCGRLTIRCSRDYFSLDCGITAYELSDYSPGDEPQNRDEGPRADWENNRESPPRYRRVRNTFPELGTSDDSFKRTRPDSGGGEASDPSEAAKRSPAAAEPSRPKRGALILDDNGGLSPDVRMDPLVEPLRVHLIDTPDRSEFWLELDSLCPENTSEEVRKPKVDIRGGHAATNGSSSDASPPPRDVASRRKPEGPRAHADSDFSAPSSDLEASGEESDPRPPPGKMASWRPKRKGHEVSSSSVDRSHPRPASSEARQHWYGSDEFLALPAQVRQSEILPMDLESLARALRPSGEDLSPDALQDVDDWDWTELNQDNWDSASSPPLGPIERDPLSPASSSDVAHSLDASMESGRLSEPLSEEGRERPPPGPAAPPLDTCGSATLTRQLLEDIGQDKDPRVWDKMEKLVRQLDGFIIWLQGALDSTGDWTPPAANVDALKLYLDTHLTFKLNVDSRGALKDSIMADGTALLAFIPARQSGLRAILAMVSGQWEQLQLQIRRQHAWMLHAVRLLRTRLLLHVGQWQQPDRPLAQPPPGCRDARPEALRQMAAKLAGLQYNSRADGGGRRGHDGTRAAGPQDFEDEELRDLLTDAALSRGQPPTRPIRDVPGGHSGGSPPAGSPPSVGGDVPERLRVSIKELKAWLRHTELLIFNSCLRRPHRDAHRQLASFKSLCSEVRARRRGVSWVLQRCQTLLRQHRQPAAERQALQLLSINLERRWEAVLMQTLHWHNRLKRELGERMVPEDFLEAGLLDPDQVSPVQAHPAASAPDDCWEWDETDMSMAEAPQVPEPDLTHNLPGAQTSLPSDGIPRKVPPPMSPPAVPPIYQVYGLHTVELDTPGQLPHVASTVSKRKQHMFHKSLSKDSTFSSMESLPDLLGGLMPGQRDRDRRLQREGGGDSGRSSGSRRSGSESGIVSDAGDAEMILCRGLLGQEEEDRVQRLQQSVEEEEKLSGLDKADSEAERGDWEQSASKFSASRRLDEVAGLGQPSASPVLSPGSSLESLLSPGRELFPSKDHLHRSASLESGLALCHSLDADTVLVDLDLCRTQDEDRSGSEDSRLGGGAQGELSRRTLDLLKRLENISSPLASKMTRSVSDMTALGSRSPLEPRPIASSSSGGRCWRGSRRALPSSLLNDNSPSLSELSSAEESSVGSEDLTMLPNDRKLLPEQASAGAGKPNSYRRCCKRSGQREEADAVSLSMVVNVSCTSACTDDEDDGDLLSSSTLTLTEEEICVQEEEEERLASSGSEDQDGDEEEVAEGSDMLALDYMKKELQAWVRPPRTSKTEVALWDELQCGSNPEQGRLLNSTKQDQEPQQEEENRRNAARSLVSHFADDLENGNVEPSSLRAKDADDELLREESAVFTKRGEPLTVRAELVGASFGFSAAEEDVSPLPSSLSCEFPLPAGASSLVGQLKGELPCQSASPSRHRKAITIQERFKFSSLVTEQSRSKLRDKQSCLPTKKWKGSRVSSCCQRPPPSPPSPSPSSPRAKEAGVHDFVMEILDLASEARRSKEIPGQELTQSIRKCDAELGPASFQHIREKVAQHSHRPLHLRKGDFYAYLALSSHDSDCGEVIQCAEDKSAAPTPYLIPARAAARAQSRRPDDPDVGTLASESFERPAAVPALSPPASPDVRDEETLLPVCTEEVYLGPPLCYSLPPAKKTLKFLKPEKEVWLRDPEEVRSVVSAVPKPPYGEAYQGWALSYNMPPVEKTLKIWKVEGLQTHNETPEESQRVVSGDSEPSGGSFSIDGKVQQGSPLKCPVPLARDKAKSSEVEGPQPLQGSSLQEKTPKESQRVVTGDSAPSGGSFSIDSEASGEARPGGACRRVSVRREEARSNEAPSYLNPRARVAPIDSSPAQCLADTKTLQSNIGGVMTKISVSGSATNPSKEPPAAAATRINPKINCRPIKEADRAAAGKRGAGDGGGAKQPEARPAGGRRRQEVKTSTPATANKKQVNAVNQAARAARGRSHVLVRPIRTGPAGAATIPVHL